jgi:hypothetical protein
MVVIPVTLNGSQKAFALVNPTTGLWGHRSSGGTVFAFSFEKATELCSKVVGFHATPPQGFSGFGHGEKAAAPKAAAPKATPKAEPVKKGRTIGQAASWLTVCEANLAKCEAGLIGGDVEKYRKSVETAKATLEAAKAAVGVEPGTDNDDCRQ